MAKWVDFIEDEPKAKTQVWNVVAHGGQRLGVVKWYGPWRKYSFFPESSTLFETTCLKDIAEFLDTKQRIWAQLQKEKAKLHG